MMQQSGASFHPWIRRSAQLLGLLLLAGLHPACYSKSGKTYMAPAPLGGAGTLFSEDFLTYPNAGWTGPTTSNASAVSVYVVPFYYLQMSETSRPASASTTTTMTFSSQPLTFVVDIQYSAASTVADSASIQIVDSASPTTILAQAVLNAQTGMISFTVGAGGATTVALTAAAFHTVTFKIDASNNATWMVGATTTAAAAFGAHSTKLTLRSDFSASAGTAPVFQFGNVIVNSP